MSSALRAFQAQLDVTGDNISNSETVGYNRRTIQLTEAPTTTMTIGRTVDVGNGVNVAAVTRVRDMFLAARREEATSKLGRGEESLAGLSKIQAAMGEPSDSGISSAYDAFTNAWSSLSASPGDSSAKADVQQAGANLASRISSYAKDLTNQAADNVTRTKEILGDVDQLATKISDLNNRIAQATAQGGTPNDLLDARDSAVQDLSKLADVTVTKAPTGYSVSLNGYRLVDVSGVNALAAKYDSTTGRIVDGTDSFPVLNGSLAGAHDTALAISSTSARLDTFADALRSQFNAIYSTGTNSAGVTGMPFFTEPVLPATTTTAIGLSLDAPIAADPNNIASGTSGLSGDGTLAAQLSALRDTKIAGLGNMTMGNYYSTLVSDIGRQTATAQDTVDTQTAVNTQIDAQISSTSGVSMDDEMANLLRFQRAYQAAAKALSVFDQMSETIIGMLNR